MTGSKLVFSWSVLYPIATYSECLKAIWIGLYRRKANLEVIGVGGTKFRPINAVSFSKMVFVTERKRIGGDLTCVKKQTGAIACIISIFSLYSGRSDNITKNAVEP